jgi:hypothetical protein
MIARDNDADCKAINLQVRCPIVKFHVYAADKVRVTVKRLLSRSIVTVRPWIRIVVATAPASAKSATSTKNDSRCPLSLISCRAKRSVHVFMINY